ncbi:MAG: polysaccharide biosynthesis tyrosine autokinase [Anaerohalosphaera sp.]|nr:polysaccharide biosynthesis tyrosine autokinase [Anaerohalosphaera sp.]
MKEKDFSNETKESSLQTVEKSIFHTLADHKWVIFLMICLALSAGFIYIVKATPIYTSSSRVVVEQNVPRVISDSEGVMTQSKNYLYTQCEVMRSTPIITPVVNDPHIRNHKSFEGVDNILVYINKNLDISIGKRDDIITVSYDSPYPEEAAVVVNRIVDSYVNYNSTIKQSTVLKMLTILQKEKITRDKEFDEKLAELLSFTRENGVVSFDQSRGGDISFKRLAILTEGLADAQLAAINTKADYDALMSVQDQPRKMRDFAAATFGGTNNTFVKDSETERKLKTELKEAEIAKLNLLNHVTANHPSVKTLCQKMSYLEELLDNEIKQSAGIFIEAMKLRHENAQKRLKEVEVSFNEEYAKAQALGIKATEYAVLQSELSKAERECEIPDSRIKELNVAEGTGGLNINILECAVASSKPSKPDKAKVLCISMLFGCIFGIGLTLLLENLDHRLHTIEQATIAIKLPLLGVIPVMSRQVNMDKDYSAALASRSKDTEKSHGIFRGRKHKKRDPITTSENGLKCISDPGSAVGEAFRTVRTAVFFGSQNAETKVILVTSPEPGEGKSSLASNLAITMAQAGKKVLIVDADLRNPKQDIIFQIDDDTGMTNYLADETILDRAIFASPLENLDILTAGSSVPNPSEVLGSRVFAEMIHNLSDMYDYVIIDSAPVLPVADAQILTTLADATILVVRADRSTTIRSAHARDMLLSVGANIVGFVFNAVPSNSRRYGSYGYGYGYGAYGYGKYGYGKKDNQGKDAVCAPRLARRQVDMTRVATAKRRKLKKLA